MRLLCLQPRLGANDWHARDGTIVVHAYAVLSQITRAAHRMASATARLVRLVCVSTLASLELEVNTRASRAVGHIDSRASARAH